MKLPNLPRYLNKHKDKLKDGFNIIKKYCRLNKSNKGAQAISFYSKSNLYVYKLCPMNIRYFTTYKNNTPYDFYDDTKKMKYFFLPPIKILYKNDYCFIYKQNKVKPIKKINDYIIISIYLLIYAMIDKNIILTDICPHNIGTYKKNIITFDIHGIVNINDLTIFKLKKRLYYYSKYLKSSTKIIQLIDEINIHNFKENMKKIIQIHYNSIINNNDFCKVKLKISEKKIIKHKLDILKIYF